MSLEYLTLVRNDYKGPQDIFTNTIKVDIKQKRGLIVFNINDGIACLIIKASNIFKGGKSRYKKKKSKKRKKKGKKTRKKKRKQQKGGMYGLASGILLMLIQYFLIPIILTNPINKLTETEFQQNNPFVTEDAIMSILKNVKNIELTPNSLQLNTTQLKKLMNSHGQLQNFSFSVGSTIPLNYRTAFAEVDLTSSGPTKKLIDIMSHMPHIERRSIGFELDRSLVNRNRYYGMFVKWSYNNGKFDIQLFNDTNLEGKYPEIRGRHFPASTEFDTLVKKTFIQQLTIMKKIKILSDEENEGVGEIYMLNLMPRGRGLDHDFHQDPFMKMLPPSDWDPVKDYKDHEKGHLFYDIQYMARPIPNTTLTRNNPLNSILSMTYEPTVSIEAEKRIVDWKKNITTGKTEDWPTIIPIPSSKTKGTTKFMDQSQGVQHSSRGEGIGKPRNLLAISILPNDIKHFQLRKYIKLKPRS